MPTMELASGRTFDPNGKSLHCLVNCLHAWASTLIRVILTLGFILITWPSIWFIYQIDLLIDKTQPPRHEGDYDANSKSFKSPPAVQFLARVRNCLGVYGFVFEQVPFDLPVRRSAPLLKEASFKFFYDMRLSNFSFQFSLPFRHQILPSHLLYTIRLSSLPSFQVSESVWFASVQVCRLVLAISYSYTVID